MTQSGDGELATIELPEKAYFKIGEVAKLLEVEPYVLRYWETEFEVLSPEKTKSGQRVYQRDDIELLLQIRTLLYEEMFTIAGARRQLARSRQGKPSYFDLQEGAQTVEGTAVAGDDELRRQLEETRRELTSRETQLQELSAELEQSREQNEQLNGDLAAVRDELRERDAILTELKEEAAESERRQAELRRKLENAEDRLARQPQSTADPERVQALKDEISGLQRRLAGKEKEAKERRQALKRTMRDGREHRRQVLDSLRSQVESLASLAETDTNRFR